MDESIERLAERMAEREWCSGAPPENAPRTKDENDSRKPQMIDTSGLLAAHFPPRERLLAPWLLSQSLNMMYAQRGIGKTHVALGLGYALSTAGEFLGWHAAKPVSVAYLDGEMPGADLRDRVKRIIESSGKQAAPGMLQFMTPDLQPDGIMPNLYTSAGQQQIIDAIADAKVVIVDNLSCLVRGGKENESESWQPVAEWALRMRSSGKSVVFIHHAGKGGAQRGTSKREDLLDTVIALKRPADYCPTQGARFEIHFEKARALYGQDTTPIEASLVTLSDGRQSWNVREVAEISEGQMIELAGLGLSTREIGNELGVNHSTIVRRLNAAKDAGRYQPKSRKKAKPSPAMILMNGGDGAEDYRRASQGE